MITLSRRLAFQLRSVFRRAFGTRSPGPAVCFTVAAGTLSVKASDRDAAVQYTQPHEGPDETLWLPLEFLADCEGKKDEPVTLEAAGKGRVGVQWRDGSVPQLVQYTAQAPRDADKFPPLPDNFAKNPPGLLQALLDAGNTTDAESVRYSLACLQLRQDGAITATDGRQLLVQSGFTFPWDGALLIPRSKVFAAPELARDRPVLVGKVGDWVAFQSGPWTIWLAVNTEGRFPKVEDHIPQQAEAKSRCLLSQADAEFLAQALPRLPADDQFNNPVTVDLNGSVAIRAKAADQLKPTEVVLTNSFWSGEPVRINTNRQFLARAVKLGFRELSIYGEQSALACFDDTRRYIWMPLEAESAIAPADDVIRIESPTEAINQTVSHPQPKRRFSTVSESQTTPNGNSRTSANAAAQSNGHTKTNGQAHKSRTRLAERQEIADLLQQAEGLRQAVRDLLARSTALLKGLKRHRRQNRALESTLDSIRQLKTLGV